MAPKEVPIVKFPNLDKKSKTYKHLTKSVWDSFKYSKTIYNNNANDMFSNNTKDDDIIYVPDPDAYVKYSSFLANYLNDLNNKATNQSLLYKDINGYQLELNNITNNLNSIITRDLCNFNGKVCININRNIKDFPFIKFCSKKQLAFIESQIMLKLTQMNYLDEGIINNISRININNTLNLINNCVNPINIKNNYLVRYFRSIDNTVNILINNNHHLEVYLISEFLNGYDVLNKLKEIDLVLNNIREYLNNTNSVDNKKIEFELNPKLGFVGPNPSQLGHNFNIISFYEEKVNSSSQIESYKNLYLHESTTIDYIKFESKDVLFVKTSNKLGMSLETTLYVHANSIYSYESYVSGYQAHIIKFSEGDFKLPNSAIIHKAYNNAYPKLGKLNFLDNVNINTLTEELLDKNEFSKLMYLNYFKLFYVDYFNQFLSNPEDINKKYFYKYTNESSDFIKNLKSEDLADVNDSIVDFNFEINRLIRGTISEEFINNSIKSNSNNNIENSNLLLEDINVKTEILNDFLEANIITKLIIKIKSPIKIKEKLNLLFEKTKIMFNVIEQDFIYDKNLGYITNNLSSLGSGFMLRVKYCMLDCNNHPENYNKNINLLEEFKEKHGISYIETERKDVYIVEFNSFDKFISKVVSNFVLLSNSIRELKY